MNTVRGNYLVAALSDARNRVEKNCHLINEALDLLEQLQWGVLDIDDARQEVRKLKGAIQERKKGHSK